MIILCVVDTILFNVYFGKFVMTFRYWRNLHGQT